MRILIFIFTVTFIYSFFTIISKLFKKDEINNYKQNTDLLILGIVFISSSIIAIALGVVDNFIENPVSNEKDQREYVGTIGDLIGGVLNPAIAVPATLLTFLAFWVQYKANKEVVKQFDIQKFESELNLKITILRQEMTEMRLPKIDGNNYEGREVMYQLDKELKFIYFIVKNSLILNDSQKILSISYFIFFKGRLLFFKNINHLSLKYDISKKELLDIEDALSRIYTLFKFDKDMLASQESDNDILADRISLLSKAFKEGLKIKDIHEETDSFITVYFLFSDIYSQNIYHLPFKGHETRLSILFRQIFTITKFVNQEETLSYEQKRSYLRTLRSLLANYDQMHIFYNWHSQTADKWENKDNKFLTDMRMIHNIPLDLLIEDFKLEKIFSNRNFNFEKGRREKDSLFEHIEIYSERQIN